MRWARPPTVTWIYGALGLLPFAAGAAGSLLAPALSRWPWQLELLIYGGLILSFLGGGRWGLEITRRPVRALVISASMLPTVVAFGLLVAVGLPNSFRLVLLALAHLAQWAWDVRSQDTPDWYPLLRHALTAGAVVCLLIGALA